jgi:hypothetical protein
MHVGPTCHWVSLFFSLFFFSPFFPKLQLTPPLPSPSLLPTDCHLPPHVRRVRGAAHTSAGLAYIDGDELEQEGTSSNASRFWTRQGALTAQHLIFCGGGGCGRGRRRRTRHQQWGNLAAQGQWGGTATRFGGAGRRVTREKVHGDRGGAGRPLCSAAKACR